MNPIAAHVYDYHVGQIPASSVVDDEVRGVMLILLWKFDSGSAIVSRPAVVAGGLVVAGKHGRVVNLLDTKPDTSESNRVLDTEFISDSEIKSPMFVAGNTVYVGTQGSTIIRINVGTNRAGRLDMDEIWCFDTKEDIECN